MNDLMVEVSREPVHEILLGLMALAAHLHGDEGLKRELLCDEGENPGVRISQNGEVLYEGHDDNIVGALGNTLLDICSKEGISTLGENHKECYICHYITFSVANTLGRLVKALYNARGLTLALPELRDDPVGKQKENAP